MKQHNSTNKSNSAHDRKKIVRKRVPLKTHFLKWQEKRIFAAAKREEPAFSSEIIESINKIKSAKEHEKRFSLSLLYFNLTKFEKSCWEISQFDRIYQTEFVRNMLKNDPGLKALDKLIHDALVLDSLFTDPELMEHVGSLNEHIKEQVKIYLFNKKLVQTRFDFSEKTNEFMECAPTILRTGAFSFENNPIMSKIVNDVSAVKEINKYIEKCNEYNGWRTVERLAEELKEHGSLKKFADAHGTNVTEQLIAKGHAIKSAKDEAFFIGKEGKLISSFEIENFINASRGNIMKRLMEVE